MKKQTAVEWLIERFKEKNFCYSIKDFEQAKEIEREQIINAYDSATFYLKGEIYFKKTFVDESGI